MMQRTRQQEGLTLIELLVTMVVGGIVSTMILTSWFALSGSYVYAVNSSLARDSAREGLSRMQREIRDAQLPPCGFPTANTAEAAIYRARPYWIAFFTTFNEAGNSSATWTAQGTGYAAVSTKPHLVVYRVYADGRLIRFEDLNGNGMIDMSGGTFDMSPYQDIPSGFNEAEEALGEGASVLTPNVSNCTAVPGSPVPLFVYNSYDVNGHLQSNETVLGTANRSAIIAVQIHTLADLNPHRSPVYADLMSTAQLRNQRD